jgi:hypothetical protein
MPPIQRRDVEVTLDSNMQETKLLLGQKYPVASAEIKLKYITVPGGWKRTKESPNQERSVDKQA